MAALPGIEYRNKSLDSDKITLKENPVAGFVGITRKGPLNRAVRITDFNDFLRTFGGFDTAGNLPFGVYSFFQNGGRRCYVVRTAHQGGDGGAEKASLTLNGKGAPAAVLTCRSEGAWGNHILMNLWTTASGEETQVNVSLNVPGRQEDFLGLSSDPDSSEYYLKRINERSALVSARPAGNALPDDCNNRYFSGGREGIASLTPGDFIGRTLSPDNRTGLALLEEFQDINLIAAPDTVLFKEPADMRAVHTAMIDQAERLEGRFALLDLNGKMGVKDALAYRNSLSCSRAALYYPDLKVIDPADFSTFSLPASCAMAGIVSDTDLNHGCYYPPGNRFIEGAVALSRPLSRDEAATLYDGGINSFRKVPGKGIKIWGVRTLAEDPRWRFINVRRTVSFLSRAIRRGTAWAVFEPNDRNLQKRVVRHVTAYLIDVWRKGYLAGKTASEAFYVKCDEELNPPENCDAGILTLELGLCVVKPAEYICVTLHAEKEHTKVIIDEEVNHE